jgi:hypothetical protein
MSTSEAKTPAELRASAAHVRECAQHADSRDAYSRDMALADRLGRKADELEAQQTGQAE